MVGFFVPAGFEPVTLTSQSGLTTHSCPTPRGHDVLLLFVYIIKYNIFYFEYVIK
jgi:hypothetical protein